MAAKAIILTLKPFQCTIDLVTNGSEAVTLANKNDYDLILMDIGLPDFSGIDATKKIRASDNPERSQVPIIAITGHANNLDMRQKALDAGMQEVLSKPAQPLELESVLQNYVFKVEAQKSSTHQQPTLTDETSKALAVIDWDACVSMCNGDPDFTREMLGILADDLKNTKSVLAEGYANNDTKALRVELHRVRGGVCYLKVPQLEQALKTFHQAVKADPQNQKELETTYARLQQAMNTFWETWKMSDFNKE